MQGRIVLLLVGGVLVLAGGATWVRYEIAAARDEADYREQLRLAWAEGLATTGAQYASRIRSAKRSENAAPIYRSLHPIVRAAGSPDAIAATLLANPSASSIEAADGFLKRAALALSRIDRAAALPRCWFDRDWSKGPAVLLPEYADMKAAAKLCLLRGSVAATRNDPQGALRNLAEARTIGRHATEDGTMIGNLMALAIDQMATRAVATWAFRRPTVGAYRGALHHLARDQLRPDLKSECRDDLFLRLWVIDASLTPAGRRDLGIKEEDIPKALPFLALLQSQPKARIELVKAERDAYAALALPERQMKVARLRARERSDRAMWAFPTAAWFWSQLAGEGDTAALRLEIWQNAHAGFAALDRAFAGPAVARSIQTKDLLSGYDGKPVTYSFDGKQIRIEVDTDDPSKPFTLLVPPNPPTR